MQNPFSRKSAKSREKGLQNTKENIREISQETYWGEDGGRGDLGLLKKISKCEVKFNSEGIVCERYSNIICKYDWRVEERGRGEITQLKKYEFQGGVRRWWDIYRGVYIQVGFEINSPPPTPAGSKIYVSSGV